MKDWRGADMRVGVTVIWPKDKSGTRMYEGVVKRFKRVYADPIDIQGIEKMKVARSDGKIVWLYRLDRVTVVA